MKQNITIIWGTDWFWKWLASFLMRHFGEKITLTVTGRDQKKWEILADNMGIIFSRDSKSSVKNADITVFAVPIAYMQQTIMDIAPHLKEWSVVADVCSIKDFPSTALKKYAPDSTLVIPIHPMFGPFIHSIAGQIFVMTPEDSVKGDSRYIYIVDFLRESWARILETSPQEHDKMMAVVQGLTHFDFFVFWETIKRLWVDIKKSLEFVSPVYKMMISSVARYMNQNAKLYGDIQMYNKENLKVHRTFIEVSQEFNTMVEQEDEKKFIGSIKKTQEYFGENAQKWQLYTDKIIFLLSQQVEILKENIWNKLSFENIYSWEIRREKLIKYEKEMMYLENGEKLILDEWRVFKWK